MFCSEACQKFCHISSITFTLNEAKKLFTINHVILDEFLCNSLKIFFGRDAIENAKEPLDLKKMFSSIFI